MLKQIKHNTKHTHTHTHITNQQYNFQTRPGTESAGTVANGFDFPDNKNHVQIEYLQPGHFFVHEDPINPHVCLQNQTGD